ncbi:hypothetical protein EHV15_05200 [Paenibacillus oralis]|uniref:Uncharacterized protein n=1 Tax=Paenibacillus oralis TaxID=2490856 RepID=A0A3P3TWA9_9BACL|nr:hypothetical protein [Paenibacillus oralis]RRJ62415.1 hypothetical protein EHV15_05200 [Paenibacillus oralis]
MLEAKTTRLLNELIQGMTRFCIETYKSNQPIASEDLKALAELVSAVNVPPEQPSGDPVPVIGFVAPVGDGDDE